MALPYVPTADRYCAPVDANLLYAVSLADDLASAKQTAAAAIVRNLISEVRALRREVEELNAIQSTMQGSAGDGAGV
jgi:hypothetical protein